MNQTAHSPAVDLERLFKLRLVIARLGEMDLARWWNTQGLLSRQGRILMSRGFPKTYRFAQARAVFAVAKARCHELFDPPGCVTLWSPPAEVEDQLEAKWHEWIDNAEEWEPFFARLETLESLEPLVSLKELGLLDEEQAEVASRLRRSAEGRSVPLPGSHFPADDVFTLLAAGFAYGEPGKPAIPYARLEAA